ncbi:hypothetical protein HN695_05030 [Candidatus Woesearchaeota archaeon]|jgi:hypothetical protein|nr:hypothetical protein [Candidatus Woesearchaeota archaeon]MBT5272087.1 hypothetical protein [Candidatus Woesearchaeota archaeon]MBT6041837.1 hypothetical protein [Candidatus Woesearchaeota archaeon]MBT6336788.1 hypothetical protein [Candidatus Woesearchaeota archaeon]MBT7927677.1 hypothetical protein [Candidatus Woesearchaeota archaeon]
MTEHDPSKRQFLRDIVEIGKGVLGVTALAPLIGCGPNAFQSKEPIEKLRMGSVYLFLINTNPDIKEISRIAGLPGEYGHIELVYRGLAYGSEDGNCRKISISDLERKFEGLDYEVREVELANPYKAIQHFSQVLTKKPYNNPAEMIMDMYIGSGKPLHGVYPVSIETVDRTNDKLREILESKGIPTNRTGQVYLPDQFKHVGWHLGEGVFRADKR